DDKTVLVGLGHCPSSLGRLGRLWAGYSCLLLPTCAPITLGAVEQNQWIARLEQAAAPSCGLADALLDVGGGGAHRYPIGRQPIEIVGGRFDHGRAQQADAPAPAKGAIGVAYGLIPVMTGRSRMGAPRRSFDGVGLSWE